ncbi:methylated-DNA--[protein]-cysteine S-methyltransferase [uncultured Acetobacteroides sp.]|uniref:methylated-DNA--[protein]-cysteine S-methyltransferase n=1 Tax=uncultured Acetobacteroides sp. TaxID=1760811 RepID=UPI0029F46D7E|nr:methylated-DNA--[protein]-cysteine S-methyltransferase [uncultured Acetobacteroides sp.]
MPFIEIQYFQTDVGELIIGSFNNRLCLCDWRYRRQRKQIDDRIAKGLGASYAITESEVIANTKAQLNEYFSKQREEFSIPLLLVGTDFQKSVWRSLLQIPHGSTETYLDLAKRMGNEKAVRAVAAANGANALSIIIPCHRVVGAKGELVGYAGGIDAKRALLRLEDSKGTSQLQLF